MRPILRRLGAAVFGRPQRAPMKSPERSGAVHGAPVIPQARDGHGCDAYAPGHLMHYRHQAEAARTDALDVRRAEVEGTRVHLELDDGSSRTWTHHEPERLRRVLDLVMGRCYAFPSAHALQVGPYWFNCAREGDDWQDCRAESPAARQDA